VSKFTEVDSPAGYEDLLFACVSDSTRGWLVVGTHWIIGVDLAARLKMMKTPQGDPIWFDRKGGRLTELLVGLPVTWSDKPEHLGRIFLVHEGPLLASTPLRPR
jgi:hypothetical protein